MGLPPTSLATYTMTSVSSALIIRGRYIRMSLYHMSAGKYIIPQRKGLVNQFQIFAIFVLTFMTFVV